MTLRIGDKGAEVRALQKQLTRAGFPISVDGDFGVATRAAVLKFQYAEGDNLRSVDGIVGPRTQELLDVVAAEESLRDQIIPAAARHLGKPYYWGHNGPEMFDCSGFVLYVLQEEMHVIDWGDDTAHGIMNRLPKTETPLPGDLVLFLNSKGKATHIEFYCDKVTSLGASGGGSTTKGKDLSAYVKFRDFTRDRRRVIFCSVDNLIAGD